MKIARVETIPMMAPADRAITMSHMSVSSFGTTIVRITTDDGIQGIGECMVRTSPLPTKYIVDEMLTPIVMGRDPLDVEAIWNDMFKSERHRGHATGIFIEAISGVDSALWDIVGKYHGMSLGKLLNGYDRKTVPAYASSVMLNDIPVMVQDAQRFVEEGYRAIKIKLGTNCRNDVRIATEIREAVGADIDLMADANSFYSSVRDAVYVGKALEELEYVWLEEPVSPDNLEAYKEIAQRLDMHIAAGESHFTSRDFRRLFQNGCISLAQPDITRCGGITESKRIAVVASAFDKQYTPHTGFSSSVCVFATLQLAAWAPNFTIYEYGVFGNPLQRLSTVPLPSVKNGMLEIPQGVGICCDLNEEYIQRYRVDK